MTPQMQKIVTDNPKGVVFVLGNDTFCIAAFNGLRTAGFEGQVTTIPAVPHRRDPHRGAGGLPEGHPDLGDGADRQPEGSVDQAVLRRARQVRGVGRRQERQSARVRCSKASPASTWPTENLKGEATPAAIIAATKAMPWSVLPASGGLHFRCNGKADADGSRPPCARTATLAGHARLARARRPSTCRSATPRSLVDPWTVSDRGPALAGT